MKALATAFLSAARRMRVSADAVPVGGRVFHIYISIHIHIDTYPDKYVYDSQVPRERDSAWREGEREREIEQEREREALATVFLSAARRMTVSADAVPVGGRALYIYILIHIHTNTCL